MQVVGLRFSFPRFCAGMHTGVIGASVGCRGLHDKSVAGLSFYPGTGMREVFVVSYDML